MLPKVSVIVPIYNVEKYLRRCLDSIVNQTYSNLEIILVNDGSPDNCGMIIDIYEKNDDRIRALHKVNGGLSDARNYGMQHVTGEYTIFVDSDDWLHIEMIQKLVTNSIATKADVVQSAFFYAYEDYLLFDNRYHSKGDQPTVLKNKALMRELVANERVKNFAWGKLYRTNLINDIPFKKGVLYEDVFWAHKVMHRVKTFVMLHQPLFYYYQRSDSIVGNYTIKSLDILSGMKERHGFIEKHYSGLKNESYRMILKTSIIHYNLMLLNRKVDQGGHYKREIQSYIKENYPELKKAVRKHPPLARQLNLFCIHPYLNFIYQGMLKIFRGIKVIPGPVKLERLNA
ncbi:glycosyltransferase family 2 protein [Sutcliffiella sp. NPDC057660]|uniref:glycosyltransferase family 2 protein n=1 Tax=Sutcliffiella sp. NPDC057660 TaxID=3346199 RepID=UPI0036ACB929